MQARGRGELLQAIGALQREFGGWRFTPTGPADGDHAQARPGWELGPGGGQGPVAVFDVAVLAEEGRIRSVLGFLDRVPA